MSEKEKETGGVMSQYFETQKIDGLVQRKQGNNAFVQNIRDKLVLPYRGSKVLMPSYKTLEIK